MSVSNKPIVDNLIVWHGFGYPHRRSESWYSFCRVRIWQQNPVVVLFSDLNEEDTGTSITNCSENLATIVQFHFQLEKPIRWFEHYPRHNQSPKQVTEWPETVDEVFYVQEGQRYLNPRWKSFDRSSFEKLVNCSISMDGYRNLPQVPIKTPWEHNQDEFARGKADARDRNPRIYPPPEGAYAQGYQYGIEQQSELN